MRCFEALNSKVVAHNLTHTSKRKRCGAPWLCISLLCAHRHSRQCLSHPIKCIWIGLTCSRRERQGAVGASLVANLHIDAPCPFQTFLSVATGMLVKFFQGEQHATFLFVGQRFVSALGTEACRKPRGASELDAVRVTTEKPAEPAIIS